MPSFNSIVQEMKKLRDPGKYPNYETRTFATQASPGIKSVMYKGTIQGEGNENPVYIQFRDVEFSEEEQAGYIPYEDTDTTGNKGLKFYKTPELDKNNVALKCMCTDFRFMWEHPLFVKKSLVGQFRKYVRKTTTYPPKNPQGILGFCKHIWSFCNALKEAKLVK